MKKEYSIKNEPGRPADMIPLPKDSKPKTSTKPKPATKPKAGKASKSKK